MKIFVALLMLVTLTSVSMGQESAVEIAKRVIADKSVALTPIFFPEKLMGYDCRDPKDFELRDAASNCHVIVKTYMSRDDIPEKVRIAYAIRILASKREPTPVHRLGKLDAGTNDRFLKDGLILAARLNKIIEAEQADDKMSDRK